MGVAFQHAAVVINIAVTGTISGGIFVFGFALGCYASKEACLEGTVLSNTLKHCGELEGCSCENALLRFSEKNLGPDVNNVEDSCGEELVHAQYVTVGCLFFYVKQITRYLLHDEA